MITITNQAEKELRRIVTDQSPSVALRVFVSPGGCSGMSYGMAFDEELQEGDQIIEHDGKGTLTFNERPFVVMNDHAYVDMGTVDKSTKLTAL